MAEHILFTDQLTVFYGTHRGVVNLDLAVEKGEVFGFLGPNGAGKSTTLRVLMDVIRPTNGSASILGMDCQREGVAIRAKTGYLPGELSLPPNGTGERYISDLAAVRGMREHRYRYELCERLQLDTSRRISDYSRGNKQKLGLVASLMHKPEVVILDEPTGGLDPLVQQTVLEIVRETQAEGRTVFFSSHILSEIQAVCDRVAIIREGKLVATEKVSTLIEQQFRRFRITMGSLPAVGTFELEGVREIDRDETSVTVEIRDNMQAVMEKAVANHIVDIEDRPVTLEEVFLAYYGENGSAPESNGG